MPDNPLVMPHNFTSTFTNAVMSVGDTAFDDQMNAIRVGDGTTPGGRVFPNGTDAAASAAAYADARARFPTDGTVNSGSAANAYTASAAYPGFAIGRQLSFRPMTTNTGPSTLNGRPILSPNGGEELRAGDLRAGYVYDLIGRDGSFAYQIASEGHLPDDLRPVLADYATATGTANAIVLTSPRGITAPVQGYRIAFVTGASANTGPVTIALNGSGANQLTKNVNAQLAAGDLPPYTRVEVIWDGFGGNIWAVQSTGLGASGENTLAGLETARDTNPQGVSTYSTGTRTTTASVIPVVCVGTSVGRGADLTPSNYPDRENFNLNNAPFRYLVNAMAGVLAHGVYSIPFDNQCVNGSFDDTFSAQLAASGFSPKLVVPIIAGMNSGSMFGVHGIGADTEILNLRNMIRTVKAAGGVPILCNTVHPHPTRTPDQTGALANGIAWPTDQRTLAFFGTWSFNASAQTLISVPDANVPNGAFGSGPFGGTKIKVGSKLLVQTDGTPGSNANRTLTVTARNSNTQVTVTSGDITQTIANTPALIRHTTPPLAEIMPVPPSAQKISRDWTGLGTAVDGLASYSLYNKLLDVLARDEGIPLIDIEWRGFRYVENEQIAGRVGWDSVYTMTYSGTTQTNSNHPVLPAQRIIYGQALAAVGAEIARGTFRSGYHVYRGPGL